MILTKAEEDMLAGRQGPAKKLALEGLVQLGNAYDAPRLVEIGYAHIHAGMALYLEDVELIEGLAAQNARMAVPSSVNIANADTVNWKQTGAPEKLDEPLTPQETRLLKLLSEGYSYQNSAGQLNISINTVRNYIRSIYEKLHVHSKNEAVGKALRSGIIS